MISLSKLKTTAYEALQYLRVFDDIKEVEVFVACNGSLLTRLNYTSHIPSNGVEEPKSTESYGIGIQAVFQTPEGIKIGFGSEPSNLSIEGVRNALEKARRGAVYDPEFKSLAKPSKNKRILKGKYHDPRLMNLADEDLVETGWRVFRSALDTFTNSETLLLAAKSKEKIGSLGLILGGDVSILQERMALGSYHFPRIQADESTLIMSFVTAMVERESSKGSGWSVGTHLKDFTGEAGAVAAKNAIDTIGGQRVKDGEYKIIFGRQPIVDLMTHIILPCLTTESFYASASAFLGKFGSQMASEKMTLYDHGALPGLTASKGITCEGLPTGKTELIKNGVLVGLLSNYYETQRLLADSHGKDKLGVEPRSVSAGIEPRNGFRFARGGGRHFDAQPGISATNLIVEGSDDLTLEELIQDVRDGLYIGRIWYTYPINGLRAGDFTCTVVGDSYLIKDGKISAPIKPNTIRIDDNIHNVLNNITGISKDLKGTVVWAADEIVHTPELAVSNVHVREIATFMEQP